MGERGGLFGGFGCFNDVILWFIILFLLLFWNCGFVGGTGICE